MRTRKLVLTAALAAAAFFVVGCPGTSEGGGGNVGGDASIHGTPEVGAQLFANTSEVTGTGAPNVTWQIAGSGAANASWTDIATGTAFVPTMAETGALLRIVVGRQGYGGTVTSPPVGPVIDGSLDPLTGTVTVAMNPNSMDVGTVLTATAELAAGADPVFLWERGTGASFAAATWTGIAAATATTYTIVEGDRGNFIRVVVTSPQTHSGYLASTLPSARVLVDEAAVELFVSGALGVPFENYEAEDIGPITVTVSSVGVLPTGALAVDISGDTASFEIPAVSIPNLDSGANYTFEITPLMGLAARVHSVTVTVTGTEIETQTLDVEFDVADDRNITDEFTAPFINTVRSVIGVASDAPILRSRVNGFEGSMSLNLAAITDFSGLHNFTGLQTLNISGHGSIDITGLVGLRNLSGGADVRRIDTGYHPELRIVNLSTGRFRHLDLTGAPNLEDVSVTQGRDADGAEHSAILPVEGSLETLTLGNHPNLMRLNTANQRLRTLNLQGSPRLERLWVERNDLEYLDLRGLENLYQINAQLNAIDMIHFENNRNLEILNINRIGSGRELWEPGTLTSEDVDNWNWAEASNLQIINFYNNRLTRFDLTPFPNMRMFEIHQNRLTSPDDVIGWSELGLRLGAGSPPTILFWPQFDPNPTPPRWDVSHRDDILEMPNGDIVMATEIVGQHYGNDLLPFAMGGFTHGILLDELVQGTRVVVFGELGFDWWPGPSGQMIQRVPGALLGIPAIAGYSWVRMRAENMWGRDERILHFTTLRNAESTQTPTELRITPRMPSEETPGEWEFSPGILHVPTVTAPADSEVWFFGIVWGESLNQQNATITQVIPSARVEWSISGGSGGTTISPTGVLTLDAGETGPVTVTATFGSFTETTIVTVE